MLMLMMLTSIVLSIDDYVTGEALSVVLDLLTFCVEHHSYHCKNYIMNRNIGRHVLMLLKSQHAFVSLGQSVCLFVCLSVLSFVCLSVSVTVHWNRSVTVCLCLSLSVWFCIFSHFLAELFYLLLLDTSDELSEDFLTSVGRSLLVQCWSPIHCPQPDTSRNLKTTNMGLGQCVMCVHFPVFAGASLYSFVTEAHTCEQLA